MTFKRSAASLTAIVAIGASVLLYDAHAVRSSDHQDSPAVVARPAADITDVFAFPSPANANKIDIVMNVIPLIPAGMASQYSFDPGVLYQFKAAHGPAGSANPEDTVLQVLPQGTGTDQTLGVYFDDKPAIGMRATLGKPIGTVPFNVPGGTTMSNGIKVFAGPRADPFFFDLFQFFRILPDRDFSEERSGNQLGAPTPSFNGFPAGSSSGPNHRGYACNTAPATNTLTEINGGFNVLSIVFEVPRALFVRSGSSVVHLWETTSTSTGQKDGGKVVYEQIERLARPAVKELFETFKDHHYSNTSSPYNDGLLRNSISTFMTGVAGRSPAIGGVVTKVLYPDELIFDAAQPGRAAYLGVETGGATGSKFGGRALTDDVITTSLGVVFGNTIPALGLTPDDGKENMCLTSQHVTSGQGGRQTQPAYPYLTSPH